MKISPLACPAPVRPAGGDGPACPESQTRSRLDGLGACLQQPASPRQGLAIASQMEEPTLFSNFLADLEAESGRIEKARRASSIAVGLCPTQSLGSSRILCFDNFIFFRIRQSENGLQAETS
jgi:hypothetical protein